LNSEPIGNNEQNLTSSTSINKILNSKEKEESLKAEPAYSIENYARSVEKAEIASNSNSIDARKFENSKNTENNNFGKEELNNMGNFSYRSIESTDTTKTKSSNRQRAAYKKDELDYDKNNFLPKSITLSWKSLTIKAKNESLTQNVLSRLGIAKKKKKYETILNNVKGIVHSGELLALMGPRYLKFI
jgi:hypothetical protein